MKNLILLSCFALVACSSQSVPNKPVEQAQIFQPISSSVSRTDVKKFTKSFIKGDVVKHTDGHISSGDTFIKSLQQIERNTNGHIALSAIDLNNNNHLSYLGNQRLPMQCTSKVIGVATVLKQSMNQPGLLNERIYYSKKDLTNWTPVTGKHIADGMTVESLGEAAIEFSDNTAINLLVTKAGGLSKVNQFANNDLKNKTFRQDHGWPKEALSVPGGLNDTSTPDDMTKSLQNLLFGNVLSDMQKAKLTNWMKMCKTGDNRIRKGVPAGWIVGDKTGTGVYYGITNDMSAIWPPQCKPIILTIYYYRNNKDATKNEQALADATKIALHELAKTDNCIANKL